jgi:hypothetical protein
MRNSINASSVHILNLLSFGGITQATENELFSGKIYYLVCAQKLHKSGAFKQEW